MRYSPAYSDGKRVQPELWLSNPRLDKELLPFVDHVICGLARADAQQSCRVIHAPYIFVVPKTRRLLRREITWSAAKEEESNILHELGYYDQHARFIECLPK